MTLPAQAAGAHLGHGDSLGPCNGSSSSSSDGNGKGKGKGKGKGN